MNLELTEELTDLRDTVRRFLADKATVRGHVRPLLDDATGTTEAVWRGLADLGATGLLVPEEWGGEGTSMVEAGLVCEEMGAALHPGPWLSSAVSAPRALSRFGATGEAGELLRTIASGSTIATVAIPGDGEQPVEVGRHGTRTTVRAEIAQVPDAAAADVLLIVLGDHRRVGLYTVPTAAPNVEIIECNGIDKSRKMFRVVLHDVDADLVGSGSAETREALVDDIIIGWGADALGSARQVLEMTVEYAKVRRQFGKPIGSFQAIAHLCVDMYETVELARSGVQYALWAADAANPTERHLAALRVKAFSDRLVSVGDQAIQVFGGIGFTWEHDAQLHLKRLLTFSRFLGSPGRARQVIGAHLAATATATTGPPPLGICHA